MNRLYIQMGGVINQHSGIGIFVGILCDTSRVLCVFMIGKGIGRGCA